MGSNTAREFTRLWSPLTHVQPGLHGLVSHLHDVGLSALAAAIILLGVVILLELRSVVRLRHVTDRSLARVFEQLDLLRFETQALLEERRESREVGIRRNTERNTEAEYAARTLPQPAPVSASGRSAVSSAAAATAAATAAALPAIALPAARSFPKASVPAAARTAEPAAGAAGRELAERRSLSSGEARLLSSLAEARARRTVLAEATAMHLVTE